MDLLAVIYAVAKHVLPVVIEESAKADGVPPAVAKEVADGYRRMFP
jgi:hypothetical protein